MTDEQLDVINGTYLILYGIAVGISLLTIIGRWFRYRRLRIKVPLLLYRDLILLFGLALPIGAIILFRFLDLTSATAQNPLWIIATGGVAVFSVWVFAAFEILVIERRR